MRGSENYFNHANWQAVVLLHKKNYYSNLCLWIFKAKCHRCFFPTLQIEEVGTVRGEKTCCRVRVKSASLEVKYCSKTWQPQQRKCCVCSPMFRVGVGEFQPLHFISYSVFPIPAGFTCLSPVEVYFLLRC